VTGEDLVLKTHEDVFGGFGVWGLGFGVSGFGFRVWGLGFGVWDCEQSRYRCWTAAEGGVDGIPAGEDVRT